MAREWDYFYGIESMTYRRRMPRKPVGGRAELRASLPPRLFCRERLRAVQRRSLNFFPLEVFILKPRSSSNRV